MITLTLATQSRPLDQSSTMFGSLAFNGFAFVSVSSCSAETQFSFNAFKPLLSFLQCGLQIHHIGLHEVKL